MATASDRRRHRLALLYAHLRVLELARKIRTGEVVAVDGPHPQRDVALCLQIARDVRRQLQRLTHDERAAARHRRGRQAIARIVTDEGLPY